jgi:S-adenosylmethionine/arginine decarboxylase-like enzyme
VPDAGAGGEPAFNHQLVELTSLSGTRLSDTDGLSAMVVAAAGAVGMPALGPPLVRESPGGVAIALLCRGGHIVMQTSPLEGLCYVDVVAREPADAAKGVEVITRGLARDGERRSR